MYARTTTIQADHAKIDDGIAHVRDAGHSARSPRWTGVSACRCSWTASRVAASRRPPGRRSAAMRNSAERVRPLREGAERGVWGAAPATSTYGRSRSSTATTRQGTARAPASPGSAVTPPTPSAPRTSTRWPCSRGSRSSTASAAPACSSTARPATRWAPSPSRAASSSRPAAMPVPASGRTPGRRRAEGRRGRGDWTWRRRTCTCPSCAIHADRAPGRAGRPVLGAAQASAGGAGRVRERQVPHQRGRGRSGHLQLAEQDGDRAGGRRDVRRRTGAADPAVASRHVPGVDRPRRRPSRRSPSPGPPGTARWPRAGTGSGGRWSSAAPTRATAAGGRRRRRRRAASGRRRASRRRSRPGRRRRTGTPAGCSTARPGASTSSRPPAGSAR